MILSSVHPRPIALPHDHAHSHALVRLRPHFFFFFFFFLPSPNIFSPRPILSNRWSLWFLPTTTSATILQTNICKGEKKKERNGWARTVVRLTRRNVEENNSPRWEEPSYSLEYNLVPRMEEGTLCRHVSIPRTAFREDFHSHIMGSTRIWHGTVCCKPRK